MGRNYDQVFQDAKHALGAPGKQVIPTVIDQNPCAHLRMPRDMIFHGWSMRLFQAWQHSANVFVGFEDPVRQPVVAHELPDILHRVQLGRSWRQRQDGDVVGDRQLGRQVPTGLIDDQHRMGAGIDGGTDSMRCAAMASVSHQGMTSPAPFPFAGQIAPKI